MFMVLIVTTATSLLLTPSLHTYINTHAQLNTHIHRNIHTSKHQTQAHRNAHTNTHIESQTQRFRDTYVQTPPASPWKPRVLVWRKKSNQDNLHFQKWPWLESLAGIGIKTLNLVLWFLALFWILWDKGMRGRHLWVLPGSTSPKCRDNGLLAEVSQGCWLQNNLK